MSTPEWFKASIFYHIYPLGFCGAAHENSDSNLSTSVTLANGDVLGDDVKTWVEDSGVVEDLLLQVCTPDFLHHLKNLGVSAIYIGPLFHSKSHGYDTTDFFCLDSRLGSSNKTLRHVIRTYQQHGFRVILDAVFNHVGREFWAFRDVRINCEKSNYVHWFYTSFDHSTKQKRHHFGDPFAYEGWAGCYDLVKLNLQNPEVVRHLLAATRFWIDDLGIDGLRLDAADCIPTDFWRLLRRFVSGSWDTRNLQYDNKSCDEFFLNDIPTGPLNGSSDILLLGEITHGSYRKWVCPKTVFHSVTNYEMWSSLWSSVVNGNMFELGHTLERQWRHEKASEFDKLISKTSSNRPGYAATPDYLWLYTFLDNHDVDRIASKLSPPALQTSIFLSFALPGVPSIYYGSEFGLTGTKGTGPAADYRLRPKLEASYISQAVHSSACPEEWESQNWEIYCLYKQMGQLYVHPLINYVFSNGGYYLFHLSSVSLGFVRFSDILNSKLSDHRVVILVCVSLGSSNISVPIKILQELTGETNFEFVDVFRPSDVPSVVKLDDQKIQIRVDHMACLIVGHDIDSVKKTLPPAVWSLEILQQQTVTGKLKSDAQVELLQWDQSKSPHEDGNENFNENRKRRSGSSDLLILEDLEWTWSSTFKDFNLCDIGQNSSRLFDSRYVKHVLNIGTCLYQFDVTNDLSNHFQWALLSIALCLPPHPIIIGTSQIATPLIEWLTNCDELLRDGTFHVVELKKDLLVLTRKKSEAELFLCVYHPLHSNVSSQDVSVPFTSSYGLSITSGRISRVTFPLRSVHCGAKPLIVILRSDGTLN